MPSPVITAFVLVVAMVTAVKGQAAAGDHDDACAANLRMIGAALETYQREVRSLPAHLSDLHPKYLPAQNVLHCPADGSEGRPYPTWFPPAWQLKDPGGPVSYFYLYADTPSPSLYVSLAPADKLGANATFRQRIERHRVNFGDAVPLVQCHHHQGYMQNLRSAGRVVRTQGLFEHDASTFPTVLERLEADARAGAGPLLENWSLPATEQYLLPVGEGPLSSADHYRLWKLADILGEIAPDLPPSQRVSAQRIAARFDLAGGRYERAVAHAERAASASDDDPGGAFLIVLARHRSGVHGRLPPLLDTYLNWTMRRRHLPGVVVAVVRDGTPVYLKGHGFSNLETRSAATPETAFRIASVTKSFVSIALMMLVEDGWLSLDDSVRKHIVEAPEEWGRITVRHLVTHTSGLADVWALPPEARPVQFTSDSLVKLLAGVPPLFAPGEKYQYNHGALLVGVIVERLSGKPFGQVLQERIWQPLGMTDTRINDARAVTPGRAASYSWDDGRGDWLNATLPPENMWGLADGGMVSTAADLVKWDAALYGEKLLKPSSLHEMWSPMRLNDGTSTQYGCGWQLGSVRGHRWVGHYGLGASSATIFRFVDQKLTVIVLANLDRGDAPVIADEIADLVLPPSSAVIDNDVALTARLEKQLTSLAGRKDADGDFYRSLGQLQSLQLLGDESRPSGRVRLCRTTFERGTWMHAFMLDGAGKVTRITLQPE